LIFFAGSVLITFTVAIAFSFGSLRGSLVRRIAQVSGESKPQSVARAIQHVMRESPTQRLPSVTAIGPQAINQAVKAIAIARRQVHTEGTLNAGDLTVKPVFENGRREGSSVALVLSKSATARRPDPTRAPRPLHARTHRG